MTVTYTSDIATSKYLGLIQLLKRWRGGIYRLLILEFPIFVCMHYSISILYSHILNEQQKVTFRNISRYCEENISQIPLAFILGLFNKYIMTRWWKHVLTIPWPDNAALSTSQYLRGFDDKARLMRRTIVRYFCLSYLITMASVSTAVKKRFPKFKHITEAGFMTRDEQGILENIKTPHNKYFVPLVWAANIVRKAKEEDVIQDDFGVKSLLDEIKNFRDGLGRMFLFDLVPVPLVYTQVVTIAVYAYFIPTLLGRQLIPYETTIHQPSSSSLPSSSSSSSPSPPSSPPSSSCSELVVNPFPVLTFLEFFFHMGLLKVSECFLYPFGDDDDDIDLNAFVDRNLQATYLIVDDMHKNHPELVKDRYWDKVEFELPYTKGCPNSRRPSYLGSAFDQGEREKERKMSLFGRLYQRQQSKEQPSSHLNGCLAVPSTMKQRGHGNRKDHSVSFDNASFVVESIKEEQNEMDGGVNRRVPKIDIQITDGD